MNTMTHVSIFRKILVWTTGVLVVLPTLLAACFGTLVAAARIYEFVFIQGPGIAYGIGAHLQLLAITVLGWVGLVTLVRLHNHFLRSNAVPAWRRFAWTGLVCGVIACIGLMGWINASLAFRLVFLGWPLIAALVFGGLLVWAQHYDAVASAGQ
ncbi:hypothetical protein [Pseudomonas sp. 3A(2025)]